jgi:7-carboxy-7-deazaguanine synthase
VRTTGCDLRCHYCDTTHAFSGGKTMSVDEVLAVVEGLGISFVLLTGGEPMLQPDLPQLAEKLLKNGYMVSIETSGAHPLDTLPKEVIRIVDLKTPSSGESARMDPRSLEGLSSRDAVKFVIADRQDYEWAVARLGELARMGCEILFSPVHGAFAAKTLISWVLEDRLKVRVNLQLHKYVWGAEAKGV